MLLSGDCQILLVFTRSEYGMRYTQRNPEVDGSGGGSSASDICRSSQNGIGAAAGADVHGDIVETADT